MKSLQQFVFEKRKNPELNKHISAFEQVKSFYELPDYKNYFMTYTRVFKVGINPESDYNTPIGIYSYPLNDAFEQYIEPFENVKAVPFAENQPNIFIFKPKKSKGKFLMDMVKDYKKSDFMNDAKWLRKTFTGKMGKGMYKNKQIDYIELLIIRGVGEATNKSYIGKMWNITRIISNEIIGNERISWLGDSATVNWNVLWRKMGYSGFCDRGHGIIYSGEPYQAVFFTKKAIQLSGHIDNKRKRNKSAEIFFKKLRGLLDNGNIKRFKISNHHSSKPSYINYENKAFNWIFDADFKCDLLEVQDHEIILNNGSIKNSRIMGGFNDMKIIKCTNNHDNKAIRIELADCKIYDCKFYHSGTYDYTYDFRKVYCNNSIIDGRFKLFDCAINNSKLTKCEINNPIKVDKSHFTSSKIKNAIITNSDLNETGTLNCDIYSSLIRNDIFNNNNVLHEGSNFTDSKLTNGYFKTSIIKNSVVTGDSVLIDTEFINSTFSGETFRNSVWDSPIKNWKSDGSYPWIGDNYIVIDGKKIKSDIDPIEYEDQLSYNISFNEFKEKNENVS